MQRPLLALAILLVCAEPALAQSDVEPLKGASDGAQKVFDRSISPQARLKDPEVFTIVEQMPEFPGGEKAMFKYISTNVQYPAEAIEAGASGVVHLSFVVEQNGEVSHARVLRGVGHGCDEEALRVVNSMPAWAPGRQGGVAVRTQYNLPVRFSLTKGKRRR